MTAPATAALRYIELPLHGAALARLMPRLPQGGFARIAVHESGHCVAALTYGVPIIHVTIAADGPHLFRDCFSMPANLALESLCVLCLSGPAAEEYFCGRVNDGGDETDYDMAREYLARAGCDTLTVEAGIKQARDGADRLVRTPWAEQRIRVIAGALLKRGILSGAEINELS
jgi:hypothetical protein